MRKRQRQPLSWEALLEALEGLNRGLVYMAILTFVAFAMTLFVLIVGGWSWPLALLGASNVAMGALFVAAYHIPRRSSLREWVLRNGRLAALLVALVWGVAIATIAWATLSPGGLWRLDRQF